MQHNIINYIVAALAKCDTVNYRQCSAIFVSIFSSWRFFCVSPAQNISISQIKPVRAQYNYKCYEPDFVRNCFVGSYSTFAFHTDTMAERWPGESLSARRVYECAINKTLKPKHVGNTLMLYCVRPFDRKIISCYYYIFDLIWCRMEFHVSIVDCMAAQKSPPFYRWSIKHSRKKGFRVIINFLKISCVHILITWKCDLIPLLSVVCILIDQFYFEHTKQTENKSCENVEPSKTLAIDREREGQRERELEKPAVTSKIGNGIKIFEFFSWYLDKCLIARARACSLTRTREKAKQPASEISS